MELETVQGTRLRTLMETWRDNINDCNIVCTPEGIMSTAMDPAHVSLAHFKIFASGVESYSCSGTYLLGINTSYFHKYIKNIAHHHDMLKLKFDPAVPDVLSIQIRSEGSGPREAEMKLLALDEPDDNHIPEQGYNTVLSMVSAELTKIIREMANNADKVWISCTQSAEGPKVKFMSDGDAGRLTYTVNHGQDDADLVLQSDIHMQVGRHSIPACLNHADRPDHADSQGWWCLQFSLRFLWSFVRAAPLSPQVKIYLQQDRPLLVKYEMGSSGRNGNLGEAVFALAPKYDDEEDDEEAAAELETIEREIAHAAPSKPAEEARPKRKRAGGDAGKKKKRKSPSPARSPGESEAAPDVQPDAGGLSEHEDEDCPEWD